ncbi:Hypothetical Protein RSKD131_4537 (plasmid) [Cereibacter sphaeroides KD131]|nr:Hypothetical Protein RSKD131_4537 [Cereibacter sphaeroides KD131]
MAGACAASSAGRGIPPRSACRAHPARGPPDARDLRRHASRSLPAGRYPVRGRRRGGSSNIGRQAGPDRSGPPDAGGLPCPSPACRGDSDGASGAATGTGTARLLPAGKAIPFESGVEFHCFPAPLPAERNRRPLPRLEEASSPSIVGGPPSPPALTARSGRALPRPIRPPALTQPEVHRAS